MKQSVTGIKSDSYLYAVPDVQHKQILTVETDEYYFAQARNGHLQVFDKENGGMVFHMNKLTMFTQEELNAFAEEYQALDEDNINAFILKIVSMMKE